MQMEIIIFSLAVAALSYTYVVYPALLVVLGRQAASTPVLSTLPAVSIVVPFHNEERWVARKLDNTLALDYPESRLQIIAVSDGSTDGTAAILERYRERVDVVIRSERRGKPSALNAGAERASGDVLVFTDANVLLEKGALRALVARFADPTVGGVSGCVALVADRTGEPLGEGLYMRYERWVFERESRLATMIGADGALFAVRRALFSPLPQETIADDFDIALTVVAAGSRVVFEPAARASEIVVPDVRAEFRRKVRMIAGGYQAIRRHRRLLRVFASPVVAFELLSHKVFRWLVPVFLAAAFGAAAAGRSHPALATALVVQAAFYGLALAGWASRSLRAWLPVYVPYYFCAVNMAAVLGLWRYLLGQQSVIWHKAER
ncbi:glycosyltransferase family 2 protein [Candidatus Nitrospira bockiana]